MNILQKLLAITTLLFVGHALFAHTAPVSQPDWLQQTRIPKGAAPTTGSWPTAIKVTAKSTPNSYSNEWNELPPEDALVQYELNAREQEKNPKIKPLLFVAEWQTEDLAQSLCDSIYTQALRVFNARSVPGNSSNTYVFPKIKTSTALGRATLAGTGEVYNIGGGSKAVTWNQQIDLYMGTAHIMVQSNGSDGALLFARGENLRNNQISAIPYQFGQRTDGRFGPEISASDTELLRKLYNLLLSFKIPETSNSSPNLANYF